MMQPSAVNAIVFASEQESGLSPLTSDDVPNAMIPIANRPMLFYPLYALLQARIVDITVAIATPHTPSLSNYLSKTLQADPSIRKLGPHATKARISIHSHTPELDTADIIRDMPATNASTTIVLGTGYVGAINLTTLLTHHNHATCTALLRASTPGTTNATSYAVLDPTTNRLLGLYYPSDLQSGSLHVRGSLLARYPKLRIRSDVTDVHAYAFSSVALRAILARRNLISSLRFDLVPYLARRQFTLSRDTETAAACGAPVVVSAFIAAPDAAYVQRVTDVDALMAVNTAVARGALDPYLPSAPRDKKQMAAALKTKGERTSVSTDCVIGSDVVAGSRTSIKKSVVGDNVTLGSQVKINGCVVGRGVVIADGVNLNSTFLSEGAALGKGCRLKDCRVAPGFVVPDDTEATGKSFFVHDVVEDDDSDFGDDITFE